jgi:hypothetical protein
MVLDRVKQIGASSRKKSKIRITCLYVCSSDFVNFLHQRWIRNTDDIGAKSDCVAILLM